MSKHTPTPYVVNGFGGDFHVIARTEPHGVAISARAAPYRNEIETAQFIVLACNLHNALVVVLEEAQEYFDDVADVVDGDYGEPAPNKAMLMAQSIRSVLKLVKS